MSKVSEIQGKCKIAFHTHLTAISNLTKIRKKKLHANDIVGKKKKSKKVTAKKQQFPRIIANRYQW